MAVSPQLGPVVFGSTLLRDSDDKQYRIEITPTLVDSQPQRKLVEDTTFDQIGIPRPKFKGHSVRLIGLHDNQKYLPKAKFRLSVEGGFNILAMDGLLSKREHLDPSEAEAIKELDSFIHMSDLIAPYLLSQDGLTPNDIDVVIMRDIQSGDTRTTLDRLRVQEGFTTMIPSTNAFTTVLTQTSLGRLVGNAFPNIVVTKIGISKQSGVQAQKVSPYSAIVFDLEPNPKLEGSEHDPPAPPAKMQLPPPRPNKKKKKTKCIIM